MTDLITLPLRFNGPATTGNGGYAAGVLAASWQARHGACDAVEVTLRSPLPLDRPLAVRDGAGQAVELMDGDLLLAQALPASLADLLIPTMPDGEAAAAAGALGRLRATRLIGNRYLSCFGCGVSREAHDGLRIVPSPVGDAGVVASDWTPHAGLADEAGRVPEAIVWAALDCPGGIAWNYQLEGAPALVTGRMTVAVDAPIDVGAPLVVIGWPIRADGRKLHAGTAIFDHTGRVLARSRQLWLVPRT